jgi:hypothetical protein
MNAQKRSTRKENEKNLSSESAWLAICRRLISIEIDSIHIGQAIYTLQQCRQFSKGQKSE